MNKKTLIKLTLVFLIFIPLLTLYNDVIARASDITINSEQELDSIFVSPKPMYRSRWIMIPVVLTVTVNGASFDSSTVITYEPPTSVLPMPPLVVDVENIWQLIFIMPSWLTGIWDESEIFALTVTWEAGAISDDVTIHILPFPLDEQKELK